MTVAAGTRLGHYEILAPLGKGGMGEVYLAADTRLSRKVALKILPEAFTKEAERVRRFTQEAKAASALNHPNIITIYDIGQQDSIHFIATEYIDGEYLTAVGRLDDALAEMVKAQQLDRLSLPINARLGMTLYFRREYDRAITQLQKTLELEPDYYLPHIFLGLSYLQKDMYEQAIMEKAILLAGSNRQKEEAIASQLRAAYLAGGKQGFWQEQIEIMTKEVSSSFDFPFWMAESYIRLGEKDKAFEWLTRAADAKHPGTYTLKVEPMYDPLRSDPRFSALLSRLGLSQ